MDSAVPSKTFSVITYNIDGLNPFALSERTKEIVTILLKENVEIVNLQEVVPETFHFINASLTKAGYRQSLGNNDITRSYFTATFVRKSFFSSLCSYSIQFTDDAESEQGRSLLVTEIVLHGTKILMINSHLESCGTAMKSVGSTKRQEQLKQAFTVLKHFNNGPAILVGDLNIRDAEASAILPSHPNIRDITDILDENTDKQQQRRFKQPTWYMPKSAGQSLNYKARYDRVYMNTDRNISPVDISLIGCEDIIDASLAAALAEIDEEKITVVPYLTPSDHRGLLCSFALPSHSHPPRPPPSPPSSSSSSFSKPSLSIMTENPERKRKRDHSEQASSNSIHPPIPSTSTSTSEASQPGVSASTTANRRLIFLDALAKRSLS